MLEEKISSSDTKYAYNSLFYPNSVEGGIEAAERQAPYMCSLQYFGQHLCGAVIISSKFILTAANCFGM